MQAALLKTETCHIRHEEYASSNTATGSSQKKSGAVRRRCAC